MRMTAAAGLFYFFTLSLGAARAQVPPRPTQPAPADAAPPADAPPADAPPADAPPADAAPPSTAPVVPPPEEPPPVVSARSYESSIQLTSGSMSGTSVRERSQNALLLPEGNAEVGGEMIFVTSGVGLGDSEETGADGLAFTDVGLLSLHGRYSFGRVEIAAGAELLVKQPSYTDELVPQAGALTGLLAIGDGQAARLHLAGGPLLADQGLWGSADLALAAKRVVHETLVFEGALGGAFTYLDLAAETRHPFWFGEVVVSAETILRTPQRIFSMWVGAELRFPVASSPDAGDADPGGFLDPESRLNFELGAAYSFVDQWDLYARFAVVDRGDQGRPETMLPILDGGFDQQQTVFGLVYHWELTKPDDDKAQPVAARR